MFPSVPLEWKETKYFNVMINSHPILINTSLGHSFLCSTLSLTWNFFWFDKNTSNWIKNCAQYEKILLFSFVRLLIMKQVVLLKRPNDSIHQKRGYFHLWLTRENKITALAWAIAFLLSVFFLLLTMCVDDWKEVSINTVDRSNRRRFDFRIIFAAF